MLFAWIDFSPYAPSLPGLKALSTSYAEMGGWQKQGWTSLLYGSEGAATDLESRQLTLSSRTKPSPPERQRGTV